MKLYFELDAEGRFKRTLWTIPFVVSLAQLAINYKKMKEK